MSALPSSSRTIRIYVKKFPYENPQKAEWEQTARRLRGSSLLVEGRRGDREVIDRHASGRQCRRLLPERERQSVAVEEEGSRAEQALRAITLFDTIIFVTENNAQKTAKE
ncbi:hypothetical protein KM043_016573 [Ampulex compressa]|nr:hypothetical protein KM043_016573 [Ampulex compressa]